jgi:hypothetical protein
MSSGFREIVCERRKRKRHTAEPKTEMTMYGKRTRRCARTGRRHTSRSNTMSYDTFRTPNLTILWRVGSERPSCCQPDPGSVVTVTYSFVSLRRPCFSDRPCSGFPYPSNPSCRRGRETVFFFLLYRRAHTRAVGLAILSVHNVKHRTPVGVEYNLESFRLQKQTIVFRLRT